MCRYMEYRVFFWDRYKEKPMNIGHIREGTIQISGIRKIEKNIQIKIKYELEKCKDLLYTCYKICSKFLYKYNIQFQRET